jgi:tetratricopeptide (TPR) repeat protein
MYREISCAAALLSASVTAAAANDVDACSKPSGDGVIAACSRILARDPNQAIAWNNRANAYNVKGDHALAIADYDRAIRLAPNQAVFYVGRGMAHAANGDNDHAIADFSQAIKLNPNFAAAWSARGTAYSGVLDYDRAIADFSHALKLDSNQFAAWTGRGVAYGFRQDHDRAIADFTQAIRVNPKMALAYNFRGRAWLDKDQYDRAIADFDKAIRLDPALAEARQNRVRAQALLTAAQVAPPTAPPQAVPSPAAQPQAVARPAAPPGAEERRIALVIGNSSYRSVAALPNPRRDAVAVADALRQTGFQSVELAVDLDRDGMIGALQSFRAKADRADWALVYFAGHGIEIDRVNHLIPVDAKLLDDRDVSAETVSYEDVATAIGGARALRVIVLDACRNNPFKDRMRRTVASRSATDRGLAPPPAEAGMLVVYSAKEGEVAADDVNGVNSPFARAFVAQIRTPGLEVRRLFDVVRDDVMEATGRRQQPYTYGSLSGRRDFFFVAPP